jgi:predicted MFS family arabinose efflux permease
MIWMPVAAVLLVAGWGSNQFTPMVLVYQRTLGLSTGTLEAMFGFYALGLIPGLLVGGGVSDSRGRRPVVISAVALSLAGSLALALAGQHIWLLFAGRVLTGLGSGGAFSAATAWLRELSRPPLGTASDHATARRAAVAMTSGFALGPLLSGLLAQWAPLPRLVPYLPHIAVTAIVLTLLPRSPETLLDASTGALRRAVPTVRSQRFRNVIAPVAPWVFAAPAIAFALLPSVVGAGDATDGIALTATVTSLCAFAGVLAQPLARRLDRDASSDRAVVTGLLVLVAGLLLAALTVQQRQRWLLVPSAVVLGGAYGLCLVGGLVEIQRLADPRALTGLTAIYYSLTYLGFAAPYLLTLTAHLASYAVLLMNMAALALATAAHVTRQSGQQRARPRRANRRVGGKRKGGDSNSRDGGYPPAGFQDRCIQPLCHPSERGKEEG